MYNFTRGFLKRIYDQLPNSQKSEWAENAEYSSYQGLYRYLGGSVSGIAYKRVINALRDTVGDYQMKKLMEQFKQENVNLNQNTSEQTDDYVLNLNTTLPDLMETGLSFKLALLEVVPNYEGDIIPLKTLEELLDWCQRLVSNQVDRLELLRE